MSRQPEAQCGNPKHPNGPWHEAAPLSLSWVEQLRQWWRRKKWGCGCKASSPKERLYWGQVVDSDNPTLVEIAIKFFICFFGWLFLFDLIGG